MTQSNISEKTSIKKLPKMQQSRGSLSCGFFSFLPSLYDLLLLGFVVSLLLEIKFVNPGPFVSY